LGGGGGHGRFLDSLVLGEGKDSLGRRCGAGKGEKRIRRFAQVDRIGIFLVTAENRLAALRLLDLLGGGEGLVDALKFLEAVSYDGGLDVVFCDED